MLQESRLHTEQCTLLHAEVPASTHASIYLAHSAGKCLQAEDLSPHLGLCQYCFSARSRLLIRHTLAMRLLDEEF